MLPLKLILLYSLYFIVECSSQGIPHIEVTSVGECRNPVNGKETFKITLKENPKSVDLTLDLPVALTENTKFVLKMREKDGDDWVDKDDHEGYLFEYISQFLPRAYAKLKTDIKPPIKEENSIPEGKYEVKNYKLAGTDVDVPPAMNGEYEMEVTIYDEDEALFCYQVILIIS